ncbi:uncharacterized protein LOC127291234 isoform X2 [Leptopilina boulardi]|uniref:uncharacterized protein LOC127291234 isoform X2 n=1 Tax=Leptopilina boulardi TaxID=63433 RepID=UPI0021F564F6|nr:uncharacterized protein LOC127291234 isoform X2 [Leptopilina boulardi]
MNYLKKIFFFIALDEDDDVLMAAMAVYNLTFTELEDLNHIRNLLVAHTKEREEHQKNKNFFEETVPLYSLSDLLLIDLMSANPRHGSNIFRVSSKS